MNRLQTTLGIGTLVLSLSGCNDKPWTIVEKHYTPAREVPELDIIPVEPFLPFETGRILHIDEQYTFTLGRQENINVKGISCPHFQTREQVVDKKTYNFLNIGNIYSD